MEALTGSGGFLVHAWDADGQEPAGWPKTTGQWVIASPSVGDVDGDGLLDVVVGTRGGLLFVWSTSSPAGADVAWAGFGHDAANTHNAEAPLTGYNAGYPSVSANAGGCGCGGSGAPAGFAVALAALAGRRRR